METTRFRLPIALAAVVVWTIITTGIWGAWLPREPVDAIDTVDSSVAWGIASAAAFILAVVLVFRWRDMGFNRPQPLKTLDLLWFPLIFVVLFLFTTTFFGWPPLPVLFFLALNTLLVGFSEELAFRGVLFRGLLTRMPIWPAIWLTTISFGAVHILNVFVTGSLAFALVQAVTAAMSGMLLMAILIRTGSIVVAMLFHALWDFSTLCAVWMFNRLGTIVPSDEGAGTNSLPLILPILFILPNFLYALFLLRKVRREVPVAA